MPGYPRISFGSPAQFLAAAKFLRTRGGNFRLQIVVELLPVCAGDEKLGTFLWMLALRASPNRHEHDAGKLLRIAAFEVPLTGLPAQEALPAPGQVQRDFWGLNCPVANTLCGCRPSPR